MTQINLIFLIKHIIQGNQVNQRSIANHGETLSFDCINLWEIATARPGDRSRTNDLQRR